MKRQKRNRIPEERPTGKPTEKPAGEDYPVEDRALKEAARFMGRELLPLLGVLGSVRRGCAYGQCITVRYDSHEYYILS